MKFTKKNHDGKVIPQTYYSEDYRFEIEKGSDGWNVNELVNFRTHSSYRYSYSCETLKEAKESIASEYLTMCDLMCSR